MEKNIEFCIQWLCYDELLEIVSQHNDDASCDIRNFTIWYDSEQKLFFLIFCGRKVSIFFLLLKMLEHLHRYNIC